MKMPSDPKTERTHKGNSFAFLISLEREKENRAAVFEELKKLDLGPIKVVSAFNGTDRLKFPSARLKPFLGTMGCLLSHLTIYLHCHRNEIPHALIFEDDAKVNDPVAARRAIGIGEKSGVDICCYCSKSTANQFLNCHAYGVSLLAMRAILSSLDSLLHSPINIHIDRLIEYCRHQHGLSYRSIRRSTIVQDKTIPFTIKWGAPDYVGGIELNYLKRTLATNPWEIVRTL